MGSSLDLPKDKRRVSNFSQKIKYKKGREYVKVVVKWNFFCSFANEGGFGSFANMEIFISVIEFVAKEERNFFSETTEISAGLGLLGQKEERRRKTKGSQ